MNRVRLRNGYTDTFRHASAGPNPFQQFNENVSANVPSELNRTGSEAANVKEVSDDLTACTASAVSFLARGSMTLGADLAARLACSGFICAAISEIRPHSVTDSRLHRGRYT
jgi:hypothetical protein